MSTSVFAMQWHVSPCMQAIHLTQLIPAQVAEIFRPERMTVCLTSATSAGAHLSMGPPGGYSAMGSSMQKLPGGATAVVQSLQRPDLASVLCDEPDMPEQAMSEVSFHGKQCIVLVYVY